MHVGHSEPVDCIAFSNNLTRLTSALDKKIKVWDVNSGECLQTLEGHISQVVSVSSSHDLTRFASRLFDQIIKIWDKTNGECLETIEGHNGPVYSLVFFLTSLGRLVLGSYDVIYKIWDINSGKGLQTLMGHIDWVLSLTFSHDSTRSASATDDKTIKN